MDFEEIYKKILSYIFPKRVIMLDVKEETEEKAVNTELMRAYINEIDKGNSNRSSLYYEKF